MSEIIKVCKHHGPLTEDDIRRKKQGKYNTIVCRECVRQWDKKKREKESYKLKRLENSRRPENREKQRLAAIAYKERRKVVAREQYQRRKNDPEYKAKQNEYKAKRYYRDKEQFNERYIKKILKVYKDATPEMLEEKRKDIIAHRELRERKARRIAQNRQKMERLHKEKEEREVRGIVKVCRIHGELTSEKAFFARNGKNKKPVYLCRICENLKNQLEVADLRDSYIKRQLALQGLQGCEIPQELINAKRAVMLLKRELRKKG